MASIVGMAYISGVVVIACVVVKIASILIFTKKKKNQWPVSLCVVVVVVVVLVIVAVWHDTEVEHALPMVGWRLMVGGACSIPVHAIYYLLINFL